MPAVPRGSRTRELAKDPPHALDMAREIMPIRHAPPRLGGYGVGWEGLAAGYRAQVRVERRLVPVWKEQPARSALDRLVEAAELAGDHRDVADDRLDGDEAERLGPERWRDESPRVPQLGFEGGRLEPARHADRLAERQLADEAGDGRAVGAAPDDPEPRRGHVPVQAREGPEEQRHTLFRLQPPAEEERRHGGGTAPERGPGSGNGERDVLGRDLVARELLLHPPAADHDAVDGPEARADEGVASLVPQPVRQAEAALPPAHEARPHPAALAAGQELAAGGTDRLVVVQAEHGGDGPQRPQDRGRELRGEGVHQRDVGAELPESPAHLCDGERVHDLQEGLARRPLRAPRAEIGAA